MLSKEKQKFAHFDIFEEIIFMQDVLWNAVIYHIIVKFSVISMETKIKPGIKARTKSGIKYIVGYFGAIVLRIYYYRSSTIRKYHNYNFFSPEEL